MKPITTNSENLKKVRDMYAQVEKPKENKRRAITNNVSQKKSNVKQGFEFVDNRAEAVAQRKFQETINNNPRMKQLIALHEKTEGGQQSPIQRMVAVAAPEVSDLDDQGEWIITTNVDYALSIAGGPVVGFNRSDFSGMQADEMLYIVHHGWIGEIQEYNAEDILMRLVTPPYSIPTNIGGIVLLSCGAGLDENGDGGNAGIPNTSLVDQIRAGLIAYAYNIPVFGSEGAALSSRYTSPGGAAPCIVNDAYWDLYELAQDTAMAIYHDDIVAALQFMDANPAMPIEEKADIVAQITAPFYTQLIQFSDNIGVLFAAGTGIRQR